MIRLFLGVSLPFRWQKELFSIGEQMKKSVAAARWVPAKNMHITLKFLGSCDDDLPDQILAALSIGLSDLKPFSLKLGRLGGFPSLKRVRVFWIGVVEGHDQMVDLASITERALAPLGFEKEKRKFHSHVTLARLKKPQDLQAIIADRDLEEFEESLIAVDSIILYKSTLTPNGAIYQSLGKAPLGKHDD